MEDARATLGESIVVSVTLGGWEMTATLGRATLKSQKLHYNYILQRHNGYFDPNIVILVSEMFASCGPILCVAFTAGSYLATY